MIKFYAEVGRKLIHLSSLWISLLYFYTNKQIVLTILLPLAVLSIVIDFSRKYIPFLNGYINKFLGFMMRDKEKDSFAIVGATYLLVSAAVSIIFFSKEVAIFSLAVLSISDTFAALIGRKYGKTMLVQGKTLEGSSSFFISAFLVYVFLVYYCSFQLIFGKAILAIFFATIVELIAKKIHIDDNFTIPLIMGIILSL